MTGGPRLMADLDEAAYHADPALSSTGARAILRAPAKFAHEREHGRPDSKAFDKGHAAHTLILGPGRAIYVPVDEACEPYAEWRTKDAKEQVAAARAAQLVPLKAAEAGDVLAMADRVRQHPAAGRLLGNGRPEVSAFWRDERTGVECRARFDWLHWTGTGWVIVDLKTAEDASPEGFARSVARYGYHQQDPWYRDAAAACGLGDCAFVFVVQETKPPYLVGVYELDDEALAAGWQRNRRALDLFATCTTTGTWPGYPDSITRIGLPRWAVRDLDYTEDTAA